MTIFVPNTKKNYSVDASNILSQRRERLAVAILRRDEVSIQLADLKGAFHRARLLVAKRENGLKQLDAKRANRSSQMALDLAEQLKGGEITCVDHCAPMEPSEYQAAQANMEIVMRAQAQLELDVSLVQQNYEAEDNAVREAAFDVIRAEVGNITDVINDHYAQVNELRALLRGVDIASYTLTKSDKTGEWKRPALLCYKAATALHPPAEPQYPPGHAPSIETAKLWKKFFQTLMADAEAEYGSEG